MLQTFFITNEHSTFIRYLPFVIKITFVLYYFRMHTTSCKSIAVELFYCTPNLVNFLACQWEQLCLGLILPNTKNPETITYLIRDSAAPVFSCPWCQCCCRHPTGWDTVYNNNNMLVHCSI